MGQAKPTYLHCKLCGLEFEKTETVCGHGCPMGLTCGHVRCPNCNFEFPQAPASVGWLRRVFGGRGRRRRDALALISASADGAVTLDRLRAGERCTVERLGCGNDGRRNTLTVFGMIPGSEVTLLQRHPSYVVRVGETELGLDEEIAREIWVRPV